MIVPAEGELMCFILYKMLTISRPVQAEAREWNMGTMMIKMSVDPALLGWDDDLEDWVDSDSL